MKICRLLVLPLEVQVTYRSSHFWWPTVPLIVQNVLWLAESVFQNCLSSILLRVSWCVQITIFEITMFIHRIRDLIYINMTSNVILSYYIHKVWSWLDLCASSPRMHIVVTTNSYLKRVISYYVDIFMNYDMHS